MTNRPIDKKKCAHEHKKVTITSSSSEQNLNNQRLNNDTFSSKTDDLTISSQMVSQTNENSEFCSSVDGLVSISDETVENIYKMRAHGKKGQRSPTRIEFDLLKKNPKKMRKYSFFSKKKSNHQCRCKKRYLNDSSEIMNTKTKNSKQDPNTNFKRFTTKSEMIKNKMRKAFTGFQTPTKSGIDFNNISKTQTTKMEEEDIAENIEIYYFDHGNAAYFRTTDCPPHIVSEVLAQQTIHHATRFWAEIFGSIHIGVAFFITFILQTYRFILYSTIRPLIVGFLQMTSDYFIKPTITIIFNGILQPPMILFYNIFSSICDMCEPIAKTLGHFLKPVADVLKEIRLIEINRNCNNCSMKNQQEYV